MSEQSTLVELKRRVDEAFAEAQETVDTARQIARTCIAPNAKLKRSRDDYIGQKRRSLKLSDHS